MRVIPKSILLIVIPFYSFSQKPKPSAGTVIRMDTYLSQYVEPRSIDIWLPPGYVASKKYAVLYMQDGQMLFDSTVTWNRQEWGVDETITALLKDKKIMNCIVVAIHNVAKDRWSEYFPYKAIAKMPAKVRDPLVERELNGKSLSENYLNFLIKELKPYIDKTFPTYKDQRHTFIAGSSMGALMALYALCEYPKVFYGAACLSTHWPGSMANFSDTIPQAFIAYLENHVPDPETHRIYFDYGSKGFDAKYKKYQRMADKILKDAGYKKKQWITLEFEGDDHSEYYWNRRLAIPLGFLLAEPEKEDND